MYKTLCVLYLNLLCLGSFGSMARFPGISRMTQVNNNTVVAASGDYADFQFVKDNLELIM